MADGWEPANDLEQQLFDAMQRGEQDRYFQVLGATDLLLPIPMDANGAPNPTGWATWAYEGRTYLLAFTSREAMTSTLGQYAGEFRTARLGEISARWPDQSWWLAIDFGLPIAGYLPANFVSQITGVPAGQSADQAPPDETPAADPPAQPADPSAWAPAAEQPAADTTDAVPEQGVADQPAASEPGPAPGQNGEFQPANEAEEALLRSAAAGDRKTFMDALLAAYTLIPVPPGVTTQPAVTDPSFPWPSIDRGGYVQVPIFTSTERMRERVGDAPYAVAPFVLVLENWPHRDWSLALNPDTPIGATLDGERIGELADWARQTQLAERLGVRVPAVVPAEPDAAPVADADPSVADADPSVEPTEPAAATSAEPATSGDGEQAASADPVPDGQVDEAVPTADQTTATGGATLDQPARSVAADGAADGQAAVDEPVADVAADGTDVAESNGGQPVADTAPADDAHSADDAPAPGDGSDDRVSAEDAAGTQAEAADSAAPDSVELATPVETTNPVTVEEAGPSEQAAPEAVATSADETAPDAGTETTTGSDDATSRDDAAGTDDAAGSEDAAGSDETAGSNETAGTEAAGSDGAAGSDAAAGTEDAVGTDEAAGSDDSVDSGAGAGTDATAGSDDAAGSGEDSGATAGAGPNDGADADAGAGTGEGADAAEGVSPAVAVGAAGADAVPVVDDEETPEWPPRPKPDPTPEPLPALTFPAMLQKPVPDDQVAFYLERHFDRVGGYVHRVADGPVRAADLRTAVLLGGEDEPVHAIRWNVESGRLLPQLGVLRSPTDPELVEYRIATTRLPHGAELYRIDAEGTTTVLAVFNADHHRWHPLT